MFTLLIRRIQNPLSLPTTGLITPRPLSFPLTIKSMKVYSATCTIQITDLPAVVGELPFRCDIIKICFEIFAFHILHSEFRVVAMAIVVA
jgi:hypothetical protein